jgi:glutamine synthetase
MDNKQTQTLQLSGVRFVRFVWCDNANVIRAKAVHADALRHYPHGVGITAAQQALPVMADAVVADSGLGPVGEVRLVPDWETLAALPYAPGHARVLADMVQAGRPWPLCPRSFLRRLAAEAARAGLEVMAAFENEFFLLRPVPGGPIAGPGSLALEPADDTVFAATLAMDRGRVVIGDLAEALIAQGIPVELYYPESGPGQHELSVRYTHALRAADRQVAFRETAHAVAERHGLRASFLPKVLAERAGSGCHLHLSLWREGRNLFPDPAGPGGLSRLARAFAAGVLEHLPGLLALTAASTNSYRRLRPHFWSGAFRCWGVDNREAALRVPSDPAGGTASQLELKSVDASANPYLALGAVIAAGLDGVRRDLDLPAPVQVDPGTLTEDERRRLGIDPLPGTLSEALEHLGRDEVLLTALGPELSRAYQAVKWAEWGELRELDLAGEVKLLLERY